MYNTANNWCKLFLSSKQEFYYPVQIHSTMIFWVHLCQRQAFHFVEMLRSLTNKFLTAVTVARSQRGRVCIL